MRASHHGHVPGGVKRVKSAAEVHAREQRYIGWWFKMRLPVTAITWGIIGLPILAWRAHSRGPWWLWALAGLMPLLVIYGVWDLKRLGPRPKRGQQYGSAERW